MIQCKISENLNQATSYRFITDMNKAYRIQVKPELPNYLCTEDEFIKIAKQLLKKDIF